MNIQANMDILWTTTIVKTTKTVVDPTVKVQQSFMKEKENDCFLFVKQISNIDWKLFVLGVELPTDEYASRHEENRITAAMKDQNMKSRLEVNN
jgi:hypothetical protein